MVEQCYRLSKTVVNPIIDWTDEDVWEFIHEYEVPYCRLYDEGYKRIGCIGCPMGSTEHRKAEFERYPKFKQAYINSFERMLHYRDDNPGGKEYKQYDWKTGEEVFTWWIGEQKK